MILKSEHRVKDHIGSIEDFASVHHLSISSVDHENNNVKLSGSLAQIEKAFDIQFLEANSKVHDNIISFRAFKENPSFSVDQMCGLFVKDIVASILGLSDHPLRRCGSAERNYRHPSQKTKSFPGAFTPVQLAQLYGFPTDVDGTGSNVAIIELGGGFLSKDLTSYWSELNLKKNPQVIAVAVDAAKNNYGKSDADGEVMLDIEVVGSVAPGSKIYVYFAPNTDKGFYDAIAQAISDSQTTRNIKTISISWGSSESDWTASSLQSFNTLFQSAATKGVTILAAAGDNGSSDGVTDNKNHVDFPASSPYVLSCGGTHLVANANKTAIISETVWATNGATGGGVSAVFPIPDYQSTVSVPTAQNPAGFKGRGVPDICGVADPATGYIIRLQGQDQVIGGTSAVAPLWSGLLSLLNQKLQKNLGFINPILYKLDPSSFYDVVNGSNGSYKAAQGWDATTGLGSPNASQLLKELLSINSA